MFEVGQNVIVNGFSGTIVREYVPGMWEIRLDRGMVCVSHHSITIIN